MKLGIGGVATFKNGKIDKFLNEIDLKAHRFRNRFSLFSANSLQRKKKRKCLYYECG